MFHKIGNLRIFVHSAPYPMPDKLSHHTESVAFDELLHCATDIRHPVSCNRLGDPFIKGLLRYVQQPLCRRIAASDWDCGRIVANVSTIRHTYVQAYDITKFNPPLGAQPMHNLLVDRDAKVTRILPMPNLVTQKCTLRLMLPNTFRGKFIDRPRGLARLNERGNLFQHFSRNSASRPHPL